MRVRVLKTDGTAEPYLHTKVLGTFHHALSAAGDPNLFAAEQMAQAVTYYLYNRPAPRTVTSDEIHLMILAVLEDTGHPAAAEALNQHRIGRKLLRKRIVVLNDNDSPDEQTSAEAWSKSKIVEHLVRRCHLNRALARVIAGQVEEKVFRMEIFRIRKELIRHLVENETETMLRADEQLNITL
jgi:hypothetical protein